MHREELTYYQALQLLSRVPPASEAVAVLRGAGASKEDRVSDIPKPYGFRPLMEGRGSLVDRAVKYVESRGFDPWYLNEKGFGVCVEQPPEGSKDANYLGHLIIPFLKRSSWHYFIARTLINTRPKYKNPKKEDYGIGASELVYNEDGLNRNRKIYINEGWADAEMFRDMGIATLGWSWSKYQFFKMVDATAKEFVLVPDVGAYKGALQHGLKLMDYGKVKVLKMDHLAKYGKDTNEIGLDRVLELEQQTDYLDYGFAIQELME